MKFSLKGNQSSGNKVIDLGSLKLPAFMHNPVLYMVVGLAVMLMMSLMLFTGSSGERNAEKGREQGQRTVVQLGEAVQSFQRLLQDDRVAALAEMVQQNPETQTELRQYLTGRLPAFEEVRLYAPDAYLDTIQTLGEDAWIVMDMIITTREHGIAPVQLIKSNGELKIAGMVAIGEADNVSAYLMVLAANDLLLSNFNTTLPTGGYIAVDHNNGQFTPTVLKYYGDSALASPGLTRLNIPGSLFRIVVPQGEAPSTFDGFQRIMIFLLGGLLLAFGVIKRQRALHPVKEFEEDLAQPILAPASGHGEAPMETVTVSDDAHFVKDAETAVQARSKALPEISLPDLTFDVNERRRNLHAKGPPVELIPEIFKAYDIRGIVGKTLDAGIARNVGQAIGTQALLEKAGPVVVARDGRHSGPDLVKGMVEGIASTGCDVVDIGAVPTGVLYYAAYESGSGSGVMVTGSHNPPDYNGFKVLLGGTTLAGDSISALYDRLQAGDIRIGKGSVRKEDMLEAYRDRIAGDIQLTRSLKIVADCGNGIGGVCAADILSAIGAEVLPLFDEVDGSFPNHHPDPSEPENLEDLIDSVRLMGADLGVAFDGDADRLGVVTPSGEIIFSDRIMMLFAREILGRNPGARIIYDVKCTGKLDEIIRNAGGEPEMYKTGHSLIKNRMKEVDAPFAAEMSGHFFFADRWYGFDCGIYSAARLLEILARDERTPEQVLGSLPNSICTPELKVEMEEGENHSFVKAFQEHARFADARISTIDGLRADFEEGWGLVRASNTTPILVLRFEADSEESLSIIKEAFRMQMMAVNSELRLPF